MTDSSVGARAYYMHIVLHDWTDADAIKILKNIAVAMDREYSRILVHELVLTPTKTHPLASASDLNMMACYSSGERTYQTWLKIFNAAGLDVVNVWSASASTESIIEARLID